MHPAAIVGIIVGGIVCIWGGYEFGTHLLDWVSYRREQRYYEEYIRQYKTDEKQVLLVYEDSDDDKPLSESSFLSSSSLRLRKKTIIKNDQEEIRTRGNSLMGLSHLEDDQEIIVSSQHELPSMLQPPNESNESSTNSSWASVHPDHHDDMDDDGDSSTSYDLLSLPSSEGQRSPHLLF
ncbi:hypothetical protein BC941DRAFT_407412 [Chlamydoabsidia padenii]|nr:hypothetical protein BC941DRAFT_407412 [Chlamydoabsidia padenii]